MLTYGKPNFSECWVSNRMFGFTYFGAGTFAGTPTTITIVVSGLATLLPIRAVAVLYRNGKPV